MTTNLAPRKRVINAINFELSLLSDWQLDDLARNLIGLPDRPSGDDPFVGWLLPQSDPRVPDRDRLTTSLSGIDLIKQWEGWRARAYLCPAGIWTIGYGHTKTARRGMKISRKTGETLLSQDLQAFENCINRLVKVPLSQNQFDALVSFVYNVGAGAFSQSTLLRVLNEGNKRAAADQLLRWVHGGGRKLPGLVRRRQAERKLFLL